MIFLTAAQEQVTQLRKASKGSNRGYIVVGQFTSKLTVQARGH